MPSTIPTFASDGKRLRNYSLESVNSMLATDKVAVERNRKGEIVQATMRPASGANPIQPRAYMGSSSSYLQHLPSGRTAWTLSPLIEPSSEPVSDAERDSAERFVRSVFLTVPLSVTVAEPPAKPVVDIGEYRAKIKRLAPVIAIDEFRRRRGQVARSNRPIEFDSERRAA